MRACPRHASDALHGVYNAAKRGIVPGRSSTLRLYLLAKHNVFPNATEIVGGEFGCVAPGSLHLRRACLFVSWVVGIQDFAMLTLIPGPDFIALRVMSLLTAAGRRLMVAVRV